MKNLALYPANLLFHCDTMRWVWFWEELYKYQNQNGKPDGIFKFSLRSPGINFDGLPVALSLCELYDVMLFQCTMHYCMWLYP